MKNKSKGVGGELRVSKTEFNSNELLPFVEIEIDQK